MILNSISEDAIKALLETKQDKLTGEAGQVLGFDASGNPVAQAAPEGGVTSFNGRTGAITPQSGDYTAEQVGALPLKGGTLTGAIRQEPASSANASMLVCKDTAKRQVVFDYGVGVTQFMFAKNFTPSQVRAVTVSGVSDPTNAYDAANKNYVDSEISTRSAPSAAKLTTGRTLSINVGTTTSPTFDGSANVTIGVTGGVLPVERGGSGYSSLVNTTYTLIRYRGILFQSSTPSSVSNGCITLVYS